MFYRKYRGACASDLFRVWSLAYASPQPQENDRGAHRCESRSHWHGSRSFGVRRPLRYLTYKLCLDEDQMREVARILNDLKTERAQVEVDERRTINRIADALGEAEFNDTVAEEGVKQRVKSAQHLGAEVLNALRRLHEVLDEDQRNRLADLMRTGVVAL